MHEDKLIYYCRDNELNEDIYVNQNNDKLSRNRDNCAQYSGRAVWRVVIGSQPRFNPGRRLHWRCHAFSDDRHFVLGA
ncbi:hypothetical protein AFERRI_270016 [Acidithiobacillus ferrivorans]|uniref:Uncharacterized protein n=1 Tax=Acidithiobacillus ferrivorans TaxID=160808 RepID=A0A060ULH2_9PROT|nr:hypothetical protein AFERRI_270016 [Acidithiobacillus ferrivorans]